MCRTLLLVLLVSSLSGCYLSELPPPIKIPAEYFNIFTETVIRIRDYSDPRILDEAEGARMAERYFSISTPAVIEEIFNHANGNCVRNEGNSPALICTAYKNMPYSTWGLKDASAFMCFGFVALTYRFGYPEKIEDRSHWTTLTFHATQHDACTGELPPGFM